MEIILKILTFILSILIGFGVWYLIFWFMTSEIDPFLWSPWTKLFYLILSSAATGNLLENIDE